MNSAINVATNSSRARAFDALTRKGLFREEKSQYGGRRTYRLTTTFYSVVGVRA